MRRFWVAIRHPALKLGLVLAVIAAVVILKTLPDRFSNGKPSWKPHSPFHDAQFIAQIEDDEDLAKATNGKFKGISIRSNSGWLKAAELRRLCDDPRMQEASLKGWGFSDVHFEVLAKAPYLRACQLFEVPLNPASLEPFFGVSTERQGRIEGSVEHRAQRFLQHDRHHDLRGVNILITLASSYLLAARANNLFIGKYVLDLAG